MRTIISLITLFFTFSVLAQEKNWVINRDHSEILFEVPYMNVSEVSGRFADFTGEATVTEKGEIKATELVINVIGLDTGNSMRDGHLKSAEFLRAKDFPQIRFKSTSIHKNSVKGVLIIRNIQKEITVEFSVSDILKDTWGFQNRFVKFKTKILRSDFNLNWNKTLADNKYLVGDEITLKGSLQLQPAGDKTPTSKHMIPDNSSIREREKIFRGEEEQNIVQHQQPTLSAPSQESLPETKSDEIIKYQRPERSSLWWSSFLFLGLLGFIASTLAGAQIKRYLAQLYHEKYVEAGVLGNLTDVIVVLIVLLYAMAFWEVGWGI